MEPSDEAITRLERELSHLFRTRFGREPGAELIRAEAEDIIKKFGPVRSLKEIFGDDIPS